ncbi:MAG: hypothetical protein OEZ37_08090, partial [Gemmatimonadota bacterium]|nr:hypothetical protein [Gemmatimonadota bacterium]
YIMLATVASSTFVWVAVTYATEPEREEVLEAFYRRVRPGGRGWRSVSQRMGLGSEVMEGGALNWTNWLAGVVSVYATLFGVGKILFGEVALGLGLLAVAALCFAWIARSLGKGEESARTPVPSSP